MKKLLNIFSYRKRNPKKNSSKKRGKELRKYIKVNA